VIDTMIEEKRRGKLPNADVRCGREIRQLAPARRHQEGRGGRGREKVTMPSSSSLIRPSRMRKDLFEQVQDGGGEEGRGKKEEGK